MNLFFRLFALLCVIFLTNVAAADQPPVVPVIDPPLKSQLRKIFRNGLKAGNHPAVFAKVGDSITRNKYFLKDIGCSIEILGSNEYLASTIRYFRSTGFPESYTTAWCGEANSFSRDSYASSNGWTANHVLRSFSNPAAECPAPYNNPLRCELHLLRPSIALIMLGTNDLERNDPETFRSKLTRVVQDTILDNVVPVLSTIPPRLDNPDMGARVPVYNEIIRQTAETLQVPLWNYWLSLQNAINQGMDHKGVHPSVYNDGESAVFTPEGLLYGFNIRNITAVEVLRKLKIVVFSNAPPDASSAENFVVYPTAILQPVQRGTSVTFKLKVVRNKLQEPIQFSTVGKLRGVSATIAPGKSSFYQIVTLTVKSDAPFGDQRLTIQGTSGNLIRTTTLIIPIAK